MLKEYYLRFNFVNKKHLDVTFDSVEALTAAYRSISDKLCCNSLLTYDSPAGTVIIPLCNVTDIRPFYKEVKKRK